LEQGFFLNFNFYFRVYKGVQIHKMEKITWGIIGCGNVTEIKSGPAFNKVPNSCLLAVMRRDKIKAEDYAKRHHIKKWYSDAESLICDPEINAIYIATPPDSHEAYTMAAFKAGKPVYVEKPMALDSMEAQRMQEASERYSCKLSVAHYRRSQPRFIEIKRIISEKILGEISSVEMRMALAPTPGLSETWRVNPAISGGGLFHDLAPHQLDLMLYFFGEPVSIHGHSLNKSKSYQSDDYAEAEILFSNNILFKGVWDFNVKKEKEEDICEIKGKNGTLRFGVFSDLCELSLNGKTKSLKFEHLPHVQQPMIQQVVNYFLDKGPNPCSGSDALIVMKMMDKIVGKL
jgi:predicted dehydrogenase